MYNCFQTEQEKDVTVLRLSGADLRDHLVMDEFQEELDRLISGLQPHKLIVSFRELEWTTSHVIGALIKARQQVNQQGGDVKLCEMTPTIRDTFRILNLEGTLFSIYDSEEEAAAAEWSAN